VEIPNRRGEHDNVARRKMIAQNQLPHNGYLVASGTRQKIRQGNLSRLNRMFSVIRRP
jgi:hypothetical protein